MHNLALIYSSEGNHERAIAMLAESHKMLKELMGENDPKTLACLHSLAVCCNSAGKFDLA
jgi:hypothetical protein